MQSKIAEKSLRTLPSYVDAAFHDTASGTVQIAALDTFAAIFAEVGFSNHYPPGMADAQFLDLLRTERRGCNFIDNCARGIGRGNGADGTGAHIGVDHFHVHREQPPDNVNILRLDFLAAAGSIIDRLGCKRNLGQGLTIDARILKILGVAEQNRARAADNF